MAYYITIREKGNYKLLDIRKMNEFRRTSRFNGNYYSLEEIDNFTSQFESELVLKRRLYDDSVITEDEITKDITVRIKNKNKLEKVPYDLVYRDVRKYLDTQYLKNKLLSLQNDTVFLNKLLAHYRQSYCNNEAIAQIRHLLLVKYDPEISMYTALDNFFNKEIYSINTTTGEAKIKYKSLHDLAMFIHNYENTIKNSDIELSLEAFEKREELKELRQALLDMKAMQEAPVQEEIKVEVKKKTKKKVTPLEGQISFF